MRTVHAEIALLEERFRLAELGRDPDFFQDVFADDASVITPSTAPFSKSQFIDDHRPGRAPAYTSVKLSDQRIFASGVGAVVTCQGTYEGVDFRTTLRFMHAWIKKNNRWQIIAAAVFR